ncbi:CBS domain-containing protein [Nocardia mexicana]|uniref:CBS domain protein n=1 Tax=Nocardia mexicana TaxID=279262 RepID=A0A370H4K6_9NOCA|nr:CBS domain-containing protein [Nocardia mexicana]RDI51129.1 CBS domain protein [Nocardia mexicana]
MGHETVGDVMTWNVVSVDTDTPFREIARALADHRVSAVPVLDRQRRVAGMVSEADLLRRQAGQGFLLTGSMRERLWRRAFARRWDARTAGQLMTAPAVTVTADTPIPAAAAMLARRHVKRAAVVDPDGALAGIVSRADLLSVYLGPDFELAARVRREALGNTLFLPPSQVTADVHDGVVTVRGVVPRPEIIDRITAVVSAVDGVVEVRNAVVPDTARGIMHHGVHGVTVGDTVAEAAYRMRALDIGALLVENASGGVAGIVTDRDLVVRCAAVGSDPARTAIGSIVSGTLRTIDADDSNLADVLAVMRAHGIRRLPVTSGTRPIGIITEADLARRLPSRTVGRFLAGSTNQNRSTPAEPE